jgi:hypothetical protein
MTPGIERKMSGGGGDHEQFGAPGDRVPRIPLPDLDPSRPIVTLQSPTTAPAELLAHVAIGESGKQLVHATDAGTVALEVWHGASDGNPGTQADYVAPATAEISGDFGTALNAPLTEQYPHVPLPDGAPCEFVVRVPREMVEAEWSEPVTAELTAGGYGMKGGYTLSEIKRQFPNVDVTGLGSSNYTVTYTKRTRPGLCLLARINDGEPLIRKEDVSMFSTRITEVPFGGFQPSGLQPDTAVAVIGHQQTVRPPKDGEQQSDVERIIFTMPDGHERSNDDGKRGLVEVIVMQTTEVDISDVTLTPAITPYWLDDGDGTYGGSRGFGNPYSFGGDMKGMTRSSYGGGGGSSFTAGELRFEPPKTVQVKMRGIEGMQPLSAFRLALTGRVDEAA